MEFHYPLTGDADLYSDIEEDFEDDEELLTRKQLRSLEAKLPASTEWETPPPWDEEFDSEIADGMEGECDGETQTQCNEEQESERENIDEEDSDHDGDTDFCPETLRETDLPPRKKKRRCDKYKWEKIAPASRQQIEHDSKPYVKCETLLEQPSALNCFLSLFSEDALQIVVDMTNKNYRQNERERGKKRDPKKRYHQASFTDITVTEMKAFIGMLIAMGMLKLPEVDMYWQHSCPLIRTVGFGEVMSRDRFMIIYRHLALFDPDDGVDSTDNKDIVTDADQQCQTDSQNRLEKIMNFSEIIRRNCIEKYASGKNVAIDESMIPFSGRVSISDHPSSYRQSIKTGLKIWTLVESETSYVCNFQFYVGRDPHTYVSRKSDIARGVVMGLMEPFFNEGRHLYIDSFYTSPELLKELDSYGTYACGIVTQNINGFPEELVIDTAAEKSYSRGYFDWRISGNIVCYSWFDKKPVYFMSTIHLPDQEGDVQSTGCTVKRRWKRQEYIEIACPTIVKDYDRYMCAMEDKNQFCKYFNFNRKCRAWYRKAFGYLLEVCVHNSRVLLENVQGKSVKGVLFRESLITALIGEYMTVPKRCAPRPLLHSLRHDKSVWHMPIFGPDHGKKRNRCRYCAKRKAAAKAQGTVVSGFHSLYYCQACNVPLCMSSRECFRKYHEEVEFWP